MNFTGMKIEGVIGFDDERAFTDETADEFWFALLEWLETQDMFFGGMTTLFNIDDEDA